jgi:hypothetical protein
MPDEHGTEDCRSLGPVPLHVSAYIAAFRNPWLASMVVGLPIALMFSLLIGVDLVPMWLVAGITVRFYLARPY